MATAILCFVRPCGRTVILVDEKSVFPATTFSNMYKLMVKGRPRLVDTNERGKISQRTVLVGFTPLNSETLDRH